MGICGSTATVRSEPPLPPPAPQRTPVPVPVPPQTSPEMPSAPSFQPVSQTRSRTGSRPKSTQRSRMSSQDSTPRNRTKSEPRPPSQSSKSSFLQNPRVRAETLTAPKRSNRPESRPPMPEHSKSGTRALTISYPSRRSLTPTVKQVLVDHQQFRILVVGKRGSGKSSLIKAAFKVDMSAALARVPNINYAFRPDDNHHLIVHECSGLEPGDAQGLRAIRDFISTRTDQNRPVSERLHAIWICIPTSDALNGSTGEGVEEILNTRRVPVVVAFTKSDASFPRITGSENGSSQYQGRTMSTAYTQCEQLCRLVFRRGPRDVPADVPAELVSVAPQFGGLINNLIMTTDRFIIGSRTVSTSALSSSQGAKPRIAPTPLVWSVALRASRDITIQASIEIGRIRYWQNLQSSLVFDGQPLKSCVNVIHTDIVEIWNLLDKNRYLSSDQFKINMSHVVKDLTVPAGGALPSTDRNVFGDDFAGWVYDEYRCSLENVRCVMGCIVDLTVILDEIFRTAAGSVTENAALKVLDTHIRCGRRDRIHQDIHRFVTFVIGSGVPQKDLILEKITDLIRQYCSPFSE